MRGKKAQDIYQQALDEFGSVMAHVALNMMESVKNIASEDGHSGHG